MWYPGLLRAGSACLAAMFPLVSACTNTIHPLDPPAEVRTMYLLDLGRHTRLAFEQADGTFIEYGYGEWRWYAGMETQWWRVPAVLFWPTQGTLARREWLGRRAEARLLEEHAGLVVLELPAEKRKVAALVADLDAAFERRFAELHRNHVYQLDFVPYDRPYTLFSNSNHVVKEWLQRTGYTVRGTGMFAEWRLASSLANDPRRKSVSESAQPPAPDGSVRGCRGGTTSSNTSKDFQAGSTAGSPGRGT